MSRSAASRLMILSIHPRHIANIMSGAKTVELRRTRPAAQPGQPVALYATAPTSAVVATCIIESISTGSPSTIKEQTLAASKIGTGEFDSYFSSSEQAVAIRLAKVAALPSPITLAELRGSDGWHPPQTWHFLAGEKLLQIIGGHPSLAHVSALL